MSLVRVNEGTTITSMTRERGNPVGEMTALVGANVKRIREAQRLSLEELSQRLEDSGWILNRSSLSKIERGTRRIDVDDVVMLAATLHVSPMDLLLPTEDRPVVLKAAQSITDREIPGGPLWEEVSAWIRGDLDDFFPRDLYHYWTNARATAERRAAGLREQITRGYDFVSGLLLKDSNTMQLADLRLSQLEPLLSDSDRQLLGLDK